jgi:hypothetical protein
MLEFISLFITSIVSTEYDVDGGRDLDIFDINEGLNNFACHNKCV